MITLSLVVHDSPPWCDLVLSGLPDGTASVEVMQIIDGLEVGLVRGSDTAIVTGDLVRVLDYDVPVDRAVTWRVRALAANGGVLASETPSGSALIAPHVASMAWLSDPLSPTSALRVRMLRPTDASRTRTAPVGVAAPLVSTLPLGLPTGARQAPRLAVTVEAQDATTAIALDLLLDAGGVLLLRPGRRFRHRTGLIYLVSAEVTTTRYLSSLGDWESVALSATEVRGPALPGGGAFRTWDDVDTEAATWAGLDTRYAGKRWLDVDRGL